MRRRRLLATGACWSLIVAAGCLGDDGPTAPDEMDVETAYWQAEVLEAGIGHQHRVEGESVDAYYAYLADAAAASDRVRTDGEAAEFVEETTFDASSLLVIQYAMQSARWLDLATVERTDDGIAVAVVTESPSGGYADDAVVHSLAVRITDEQSSEYGEVRVTVDGETVEG